MPSFEALQNIDDTSQQIYVVLLRGLKREKLTFFFVQRRDREREEKDIKICLIRLRKPYNSFSVKKSSF